MCSPSVEIRRLAYGIVQHISHIVIHQKHLSYKGYYFCLPSRKRSNQLSAEDRGSSPSDVTLFFASFLVHFLLSFAVGRRVNVSVAFDPFWTVYIPFLHRVNSRFES